MTDSQRPHEQIHKPIVTFNFGWPPSLVSNENVVKVNLKCTKMALGFIAFLYNCNFWLTEQFQLCWFGIFFARLRCLGEDTSGKNPGHDISEWDHGYVMHSIGFWVSLLCWIIVNSGKQNSFGWGDYAVWGETPQGRTPYFLAPFDPELSQNGTKYKFLTIFRKGFHWIYIKLDLKACYSYFWVCV